MNKHEAHSEGNQRDFLTLFRNYDSLWRAFTKERTTKVSINVPCNNIQDVLSIHPAVKVMADRDELGVICMGRIMSQ